MTPDDLELLIRAAELRETRRIAQVLAIEELHGRGMSLRAIGSCLGVSHEYVRQVIRSLGVNSP